MLPLSAHFIGGDTTPSCEAYCDAVLSSCATHTQFDNEATCLAVCGTWETGTDVDATMDNTVGCHQYHALAAADAPDPHCVHAGPAGDEQCGSLCDNFCELAMVACPGDFSGEAGCLTTCMGWPSAGPYDTTWTAGNSQECRLFYATIALESPSYCDNVANNPPGACID